MNVRDVYQMLFSHYDPKMVEWFVQMVEERKTKHRSEEEKKAW